MLLLMTLPAWGWGATGHRVVGEVAEHHLSPGVAAAVEDLMGAESLARASTWPDEIRSDRAHQEANPDEKRWHYINAAPDQSLAEARAADPWNIWDGIEQNLAILGDTSLPDEERVIALRWLVHLVGDAHQPLHAGYGHDWGGNRIVVTWFGEPTNLHSVWDEELIAHTKLSYTELADFVDVASQEQVADWQDDPIEVWIQESRDLLEPAYKTNYGKLEYGYVYEHMPTVERRLLQGGVRLAYLLETTLEPVKVRKKRR
jgi:hypothetical protein